jgi:type IV secretion system protein VirD4
MAGITDQPSFIQGRAWLRLALFFSSCIEGLRLMRRFKAICRRVWVIGCRWSLLAACGVTGFAVVNLGLAYPAGGCLMLAYAAWKRLRRWRGSGWAYGTAVIGDFLTVCKAGFLTNSDGLIIGRASFTVPPTRWQTLRRLASFSTDSRLALRLLFAAFFHEGGNSLIRIHNYVHLAVFGSTGSGKGVGIVLPILLSYFGSCVVTDPKGENFKLSSAHRKKHGHTIVCIDPFGLTGVTSDSLNPLDLIDDLAADFPEQVADLADSLIIVSTHEMQPHFPESAKIVLGCIIAYVCAVETEPENRNMHMVRHILKSRHRFNDAIVAMQLVTSHGGLIAGYGHMLTWYVEKELAGIQTTISRFTSWLDSPAMQAITTTSTFDPRKFKSCKATLYLVLPPERLKTLSPLMRMWISTMLRAAARGVPDESQKILFLLDEAGHLGHMQILEDAVTLMRGYGIRLLFCFQSIGQVSEAFGERASRFLDNIGTQLYMGVNAYESAEAISKRSGDATLLVQSLNDAKSFSRPSGGFSKDAQHGSVSDSRSLNYAEMGRPLFRPDEVLRLSEEVGLLFHRNLPVIPIKLLRYYKEREFRRGGCAAYRGGVGWRAGILAVSALFCSLCLLAGSGQLLSLQRERQRLQAVSRPLPRMQVIRNGYGGRGYTLPPYPAGNGGRQRPLRRGYRR